MSRPLCYCVLGLFLDNSLSFCCTHCYTIAWPTQLQSRMECCCTCGKHIANNTVANIRIYVAARMSELYLFGVDKTSCDPRVGRGICFTLLQISEFPASWSPIALLYPDSEIGRNFYGWRGVDFRIFSIFHSFLLKMGVLVHPQLGLLWPASLPGAFFFFLMSLLTKNTFFHDFWMIFLKNDYYLSSNRGTTYETSILDPIEFWWVA